jgi:hypothetical protein
LLGMPACCNPHCTYIYICQRAYIAVCRELANRPIHPPVLACNLQPSACPHCVTFELESKSRSELGSLASLASGRGSLQLKSVSCTCALAPVLPCMVHIHTKMTMMTMFHPGLRAAEAEQAPNRALSSLLHPTPPTGQTHMHLSTVQPQQHTISPLTTTSSRSTSSSSTSSSTSSTLLQTATPTPACPTVRH